MLRFPLRSNFSRFLWKETLWFLGLLGTGITSGILVVYFFGTPNIRNIDNYPFKQTSILYDRTGTHELYRVYDEENRILIPHENIPDSMRYATVSSEDANFFSHHGIDFLAIARAIKVDIESRQFKQGASTITQQLARNLFLTRERTIDRKIKEVFLAVKIDHRFSKEEILDLYLNTVPYGSNAYGVETAAETYFHKEARDLSIDESALLAVLPNAPTRLSPYGKEQNELRRRQLYVLDRMHNFGYINDDEYQTARNTDTFAKIKPVEHPIVAPHFVFYTIDNLMSEYGKKSLFTGGWKIYTTLDYDLQQAAEEAVKRGAERNVSRRASNAALVALDPKSGEVLSMVGSKNYFDPTIDGNVNVTTRSRQPGSAFKPFAYATAFEKGFQPETPIFDVPINFGPDGSGKNYIPHNYDGRFHGLLTMRKALAMSLNVPAVQTLAIAGIQDTIQLASRLGISTLTPPDRFGLALVLGGAEVKPIEMASAFGVFSQEGMRYPVDPIQKIINYNGKEVTNNETDRNGYRVLDPEIARKINSILSDNSARAPIFGTHSPLAFPSGVVVAAKTGTTQYFRDAWTVGYTPSIAVAVWVGNNNNRPMAPGSDGIFVAAPIFREFMNSALQEFPNTGFAPYARQIAEKQNGPIALSSAKNTKTIYIDKKTGKQIPADKAKKMKKKKVQKITVPDGGDDGGGSGTALANLKDVMNFYGKNTTP